MRSTWQKTTLLLAVAAGLALAGPAAGQSKSGKKGGASAAAKSGKSGKAPRAGGRDRASDAGRDEAAREPGLAGLSDDALLAELAGRRMPGLLEHAFEANKVPQQQRLAMMALPAIARLGDRQNPPKPHERVMLINQIAAGADKVVASIDDPRVLMEHSTTLVREGVQPEVNVMEYWGETAKARARLKPVIDAVMKMLGKAIETATETRTRAERELERDPNSKRAADAWTKAEEVVNTAEYTRAMLRYNEAMAVPDNAKGLEKRRQIAEGAMKFLEAYDNAESGIQAAVRNRMAKLLLVQREYGPANDLFDTVITGTIDDKQKIEPAPKPFDQYEARYFSVVAELMQGNLKEAEKGLAEVIAWQQEHVKGKGAEEQVAAAAEMLRYRILMERRKKLKDPAGKKKAEDDAMAVLMDLSEKQPHLRGIIAEQLIEAMGDKVDVKGAKPLILQALVDRAGQASAAIEDPAKADATLVRQVEQGIEAAREMMVRKDPAIKPDLVGRMASRIPAFYEKLGRRVEAAQAYMDFIEQKRGEKKLIDIAFAQAGYLLSKVLADPASREDAAFNAAWERFLPMAVNQFGRKELAFELANRLRLKSPPQPEEAIKYFRMVPANNKAYPVAKFREMVALTDLIYAVDKDNKPLLKPDQRAARVQEALKAAEEVKRLATEGLKTAKDPAELRSRIAVVTLTQAELDASGEKPNWARVLEVLQDFEKQSEGVENADALNKKVMELRVAAQVQLDQTEAAAATLQKLVAREPGGRAAGLVLGILQKLNEDFDRARAAGDADRARKILKARVGLSGVLVQWAAKHADAKVRANVYTYEVYDADTQRLYAQSLEDEAERKASLQRAMTAFQRLQSGPKVAEYKAIVAARKKENPEDKTDPDQPDPAVTLGMALVSYDLGAWKTASQELKRLRFNGKLGSRQVRQTDAKTQEQRIVPNDQYWEAMYKYYNGTYEWAQAGGEDADAQAELNAVRTLLRRDYVAGASDVGGVKWREPFEKLRKELIPEFDLASLQAPAAAGDAAGTGAGGDNAPASQPAEPQPEKEPEPVAAGAAK